MRKKIEPFVDDEMMEPRQEEVKEPVSDEELDVMMRWYELAFYLEKNRMVVLKNRIKLLMELLIGVHQYWKNGRKNAKKDLRFLSVFFGIHHPQAGCLQQKYK